MTYPDFQRLCESDPGRANALCAEAMGFTLSKNGAWWESTEGNAYHIFSGEFSPTTDRNHAAMMVKAVGLLGNQRAFLDAAGITETMAPRRSSWDLLVSDPALIAWACVEALKKEEA